ncbi:MAG: replicative DNA helicase [SAR324 cluster bacterium]|nr:replicative DNA helicase [SAR324 cluster bacterium]
MSIPLPIQQVPHNIEAEQAVLGSIIYEPGTLDEVASLLTPLSFYSKQHEYIFSAMLELTKKGQPIDIFFISNELKSKGLYEKAGCDGYLSDLECCVPQSRNATDYAKVVKEKATVRTLLNRAQALVMDCNNPATNPDQLLATLERDLSEIAAKSADKKHTFVKDILVTNYEELEKVSANDDAVIGLSTGFSDLDQIILGLQPSDLLVLAARPSMGKTAFVLNMMKNATQQAPQKGTPVFFSLEMPKEKLVNRLWAAESKVPLKKIKTGNLDPEDWDKLALGLDTLSQIPMCFYDTPNLTPFEMSSICKKLDKDLEGGVSMIIVDYLQLMDGDTPNTNRELEIANISRKLKGLAKDLSVPVIALSQLNRSLESRADKRPTLSDLRESGQIEQDADIIMFIYRDEVYNEDSSDKGLAEILVSKNRDGE